MILVAAGKSICKLVWAQVDLRVRLELVPALAFNVMHMQDGHLDLLGKVHPQARLRELPLMCLRDIGMSVRLETRPNSARLPHRRHDLHLVSFH